MNTQAKQNEQPIDNGFNKTVAISIEEYEKLQDDSNALHDQKRQRELAIEGAAKFGQYEPKALYAWMMPKAVVIFLMR